MIISHNDDGYDYGGDDVDGYDVIVMMKVMM